MIYLLLLLTALLGIFLRLQNISPFKFYPDAYQNLIVAENITKYHSVLGSLGDMGVVYPYFFMWSRSGYALSIDLANLVFNNLEKSAIIVGFAASVMAIIVSFFYMKAVFKSNGAGIMGAFLLAISFNHTVWSGFIYTESLGVLLIIILLWSLFSNLDKKPELADWRDLLTGAVFSASFFTRYEYLVLAIPISLLIYFRNKQPLIKLANLFVSFFFFTSLILFQIYPLSNIFNVIFYQVNNLLLTAGLGILVCISVIVLKQFILNLFINSKSLNSKSLFRDLVFFSAFFLSAFLIFQTIFPQSPLSNELSGIRKFFINEPLIWLLSLIGLWNILKSNFKSFGYFGLISILLLYPFYYQVNHTMQRYVTHLLPFLLMFAGYGLLRIFWGGVSLKAGVQLPLPHRDDIWGKLGMISLIILIPLQLYLTYNGIKNWDEGRWFRLSYDQKSAQILKNKLGNEKMLIASMPETYYFFTKISTQSILENDQPPFLNIPGQFDEQPVLIIQDKGMDDLFPNFSYFLDQNLADRKITEYWVGEKYNFGIRIISEDKPVRIYKLKLKELKEKIKVAIL